jgi:hypothetical protein
VAERKHRHVSQHRGHAEASFPDPGQDTRGAPTCGATRAAHSLYEAERRCKRVLCSQRRLLSRAASAEILIGAAVTRASHPRRGTRIADAESADVGEIGDSQARR